MDGNNATWLILLTLVAFSAALFLFAGTSPEQAMPEPTLLGPTASTTPPVVSTPRMVQAPRPLFSPTVDAGMNFTMSERGSVRLHGEGRDPSGEMLTYHWRAEGGQGYFNNAYLQDPIYTAPSLCACEGCVMLTLTVTNNGGISVSDRLYVRVRGDEITCLSSPTGGPCGPIPCGAPCREPVEQRDRCQPDPPPCESPCIRHVMPEPRCSRAPVPCCDSPCGWPMELFWPPEQRTARPADRPTPLIERQYPVSMDEGGAVSLNGRVNNPACTSVCFAWTASKGWFEDDDTLFPIYHAPMSDRPGGEDVAITLTIHDGFGGRGYDQIRIHINNLDYPYPASATPSNNWLLGRP